MVKFSSNYRGFSRLSEAVIFLDRSLDRLGQVENTKVDRASLDTRVGKAVFDHQTQKKIQVAEVKYF